MKALFFFPSTGYYNRSLSNPLGLLAIGSYLKEHGHEVKIADRNIGRVNIAKLLKTFSPDVVGVSIMSSRGLEDAEKISKAVKKAGFTVVWGGQVPSMQTDTALGCPYVDFVSVGEGEITWLEMLEALEQGKDLRGVAGLAYRENGKTVYTAARPFADLSTLSALDFSLIDTPRYLQTYLGCKKMIYLYSAKGCPFHCAFCTNTVFHKSTYRKRPTQQVIGEIKELVTKYGVDGIFFSDEIWVLKREDMLEFCTALRESGVELHWGVELRVGIMNDEDFRVMFDAGCRWITFGIESGNKEILKRIHKNIDYDRIAPTIAAVNAAGITSVTFFIIGYPGETEDQLRDTVRLINTIHASLIPVYHFTPLPGTEIYDEVVRQGVYKPPKSLRALSRVVATESLGQNLSQAPDRDLKVIRCWYNWKAFTGKNAIRSGKSFEFAKDTVLSGLHAISQKGALSFFADGFLAMREFLYNVWYAHAYPSVIKKYGLNTEESPSPGRDGE